MNKKDMDLIDREIESSRKDLDFKWGKWKWEIDKSPLDKFESFDSIRDGEEIYLPVFDSKKEFYLGRVKIEIYRKPQWNGELWVVETETGLYLYSESEPVPIDLFNAALGK